MTLDVVAERVDRLWNAADYLCRQAYLRGESVPGYERLCQIAKERCAVDYSRLPSDIAQETLKKLCEAWRSFFKLRARFKEGSLKHRPGLPRYRKHKDGTYPKDFIPIKTDRSYRLSQGILALTLPADLRGATRTSHGRLFLSYRGKLRFVGRNGRAELVFDKGDRLWRMTVSVETAEKVLPSDGRAAGIDLGLRVSASLSIEGQPNAHHFAGREMLKEYQYWTRRIARHQRELSERKLKTSRQLLRLYERRRRRLEHAQRSIAKAIAGLCRSSAVKQVFIGWPKGIRDDVKVCKDWRGRIHNYWAFHQFGQRLIQALEKQGIVGALVGERWTSSTCPWTQDPEHRVVRAPRWKLSCKDCGKSMHSDAAGSVNILAFQKPGLNRDGVKATPAPRTQEWNHHTWDLRANRRAARRLAA